jgi:hypothetical protein
MAVDFKTATDVLFAKTKPEDLAQEIGCSPQTIRQARMGDDTGHGRRSPPPGWEAGAVRLARKRAEQFRKLADKLSQ